MGSLAFATRWGWGSVVAAATVFNAFVNCFIICQHPAFKAGGALNAYADPTTAQPVSCGITVYFPCGHTVEFKFLKISILFSSSFL